MKYLVVSLLFLGYLGRYWQATNRFTNGEHLRISGTVFSEPQTRSRYQVITLAGISVALYGNSVSFGDTVVVEGIYHDGTLTDSTLVLTKEGTGILTRAKKKMLHFVKRSSNPPHSSLIAGMALGSKSLIGYDFWERLKQTGTAHVVVASGTNIALVGGVIVALAPYVGRKKALAGASIFIWLYVLLVGFDPPIVRAGIMGSITFLAQSLGRERAALRSLVITAVVMLFISPLWIADVGFLLSFSATLSLILFEAPLNRLIHFLPNIIREAVATSLAAQIVVTPLLLVVFGAINPLSPVINALISPVIAPITVLSLVSLTISLVAPSIAQLMVYMILPLTTWFVAIITLFS